MKFSLKERGIFSFCLAAFFAASGSASAEFAIRDGDSVVFLGDSITEQRLYTTYIEAYALTRHPDWKLSFRNVGWGGDTSWLRQRSRPDEKKLFGAEGAELDAMVTDSVRRGLERDVLPHKPTFVTVKFGMNDHSYQAFRPDIFRAYVRSQKEIHTVLAGRGARVAFLTPQPIEDKRPDPDQEVKNVSLRKFSDGLKEVARESGAGFVDQFDPYMAVMMSARAKDPKAYIGGGDAVHPGPEGQLIMAWAVLKGLGADAGVSRADVDAGAKTSSCTGCQITDLMVAGGGVSFSQRDRSLPFPVDKRAEASLKLVPILEDLGRHTLCVKGLSPGRYEVRVDGEMVLKAGGESLEAGIDLNLEGTASTRQSQEILKLVVHKNDLYFNRWRSVQLYSFPAWAKGEATEAVRTAELARLDAAIAAAEQKIEEARKIKPHRMEVRRLPE